MFFNRLYLNVLINEVGIQRNFYYKELLRNILTLLFLGNVFIFTLFDAIVNCIAFQISIANCTLQVYTNTIDVFQKLNL